MTVGGIGDVLAGLVAGFEALGMRGVETAAMASFANGMAGTKARAKFGNRITASDLYGELREFLDHVSAVGAGTGRQAKYARHLWEICERLGVPVGRAKRQDVERLIVSLREGYVDRKGERRRYSSWTLADFVMVTKGFFKFVTAGNTGKDTPFPEEVRWLKKAIKQSEQEKPEFLTPQEVEAMIKPADSQRGKSMISVGFEGGQLRRTSCICQWSGLWGEIELFLQGRRCSHRR